jgi:transposase
MKGEEVRNIVLSKLQKGEGPTKIFRDLNGQVSSRTIKRWSKSLRDDGALTMHYSSGRPRSARTPQAVGKAKRFLKSKAKKSIRKLARKLTVSRSSASRILHNDLRSKAYKVVREPKLTERQMRNRIKFANWVRNNFSKTQTMRFVFSDEKIFTVDGVFNRQNERVWAESRAEADTNGGIYRANKFSKKSWYFLRCAQTAFRQW